MEARGTGENTSQRVQSMVMLVLAGPKVLLLPEKTIDKYPDFATRFVTVPDGKKLDLTTWPTGVVHVLVMFLFTGTYQDLHELGKDELELYDEPEAMLHRVLQTYLLATLCGLDRLIQLAVHVFDVTSRSMSLPGVLLVLSGSNVTFDNEHFELMHNLVQRASRVGWEAELDEGLGTYRLALKNDGTIFGALFSHILEQRARIRDLMHENERLTDRLDSERWLD
ncbi:uncharacterized protein NECHADRAFT_78045 [Fusarium vanettenii 77-13-4]|uniref:BTB domain-containing protein n=1 Tax=Fusarium vanettenii (strain ATCC MYA-4622 / CBS 123669 / FGSC 9596 / NRRL 45880 / 77-13-4) TaxID=660122 RepID=C7YMY9_FUSV7|nr:uncharacterized protein NECHADRAFT_78045 [Fusarium vanettenii 77-13-4]EEU47531.1 predicted protein [Fusarium vanettenii 77-13-4]